MSADAIIQALSTEIYQPPLSNVRDEADYPNLSSPLHLTILLLDCDTEIEMNGILGFLENSTGRHLTQTIQALRTIGAVRSAALLESVQSCMTKHGVTWERLRSDFDGTTEYQVISFRELHGNRLDSFTGEIHQLAGNFSLFNSHNSVEDSYAALCDYLDDRLDLLQSEVEKRKIADTEPPPNGSSGILPSSR